MESDTGKSFAEKMVLGRVYSCFSERLAQDMRKFFTYAGAKAKNNEPEESNQ